MLVVLTADQRGSRRTPDRVPAVERALNQGRRASLSRRFERTAGDEVQGVLSAPPDVMDAVETLVRSNAWSIGLGIGDVELPLPRSTRAGRGPAFVLARRAVDAAKNNPSRLAVVADDVVGAARLETVLMLWADLLGRRTPGGWQVADLLAEGLTHEEAARRLGISQSAVSQRAATAGVGLAARGRMLAVEMLGALVAEEQRPGNTP